MKNWKPINDYPKYEVSSDGEVRNVDTDRILKISTTKFGYKRVRLYNADNTNRGKYFFVHRLVAVHFVDNPKMKPYVNHVDGDKANNDFDNLEWMTARENTENALDRGAMDHIYGNTYGAKHA